MKALKSPLAKAILRDPVASKALVCALLNGGTFVFKGQAYQAVKVPKAET